MKLWSALIVLAALTAAILLNTREENKPAADSTPVSEIKPTATQAITPKLVDKADDEETTGQKLVQKEEEPAPIESTPASIAQPEAALQPQPPVPEFPVWNVPKPKPENEMWTLRETVKADMSDRTLLLITYGQSPRPNFRVEAWEPSILAQDER